MPVQTDGEWGDLKDWPLIGLHVIVTQDGKVLSFGTDDRGMQGAQFIYDVWDPVTDTHTTLENTTPTDIFCSAAIILPGTNKILIGGGDDRENGNTNAGVDDVNFFDSDDFSLTQSTVGAMNFERWYPTMVTLASGQAVIMGGRDNDKKGIATPEIFTEGEGWRTLDGATDADIGREFNYPRAWVNGDGEIVYFATGKGRDGKIDVVALDPSGDGSLRTIGEVPFNIGWDTPSIMYEAGKVLMLASNGDAWTMDITGSQPVFERSESLDQVRKWADLTVMADGTVLVNGGSSKGNKEDGSTKTAAIWDPDTGTWEYVVDEDNPRLYHSGSVLLVDGTVLSLGGGAPGDNNYLDGQIYKPPYLYDDNGDLADRPEITDAPDAVLPGETFTITVDDAASIEKLTFVKNGAATHSFNMEARMVELDFVQGAGNTLEVTVPDNANLVTAGSWMLFAWDSEGVPSVAPVIAVDPSQPAFDGIGDLTADYILIDANADSLDEIDFGGTVVHSERVGEISESSNGAFYAGGPANDFAVRFTGDFDVAADGDYTFYLTSDDGSRLFIDGEMIIDNDGVHGSRQKTAVVNLDGGDHEIEVRYFEAGGPGSVDLDWAGPGFGRKQMTFDGAEENLLVNGGFEIAGLTSGYEIRDSIPGWLSSAGNVEVWADGFEGNRAASGQTMAEIDGERGTVSQSVQTTVGQKYELSFDYAGRIGHVAEAPMEVLWNGVVVATVTPDDSNYEKYSFEVTGTGGNDTLGFRSVAGVSTYYGGALDSVVLKPTSGDTIPPDPGGYDTTINGTRGDDVLDGTDGNDLINLYDGTDVVLGSRGNDKIIGHAASYDQVDYDGAAADYTFTVNADGSVDVAHPQFGTDTLVDVDGFWFRGEGEWYPIEDLLSGTTGPVPGDTIEGTDQDDYLSGTIGDDVINGLGGVDVIVGTTGNDVIDGGGAEYDQVDYAGAVADYTFSSNADGSVTAAHATRGTDTLKDIDGIWFSGDNQWLAVEDLPGTTGGGAGQTVSGTSGNDYLFGTSGDDVINTGAGVDVVVGSRGDDKINGTAGDYEQIDYAGSSTDYTFTDNADGTVTVAHATRGTDTLTDIDGFWFLGEEEWYPIEDLLDDAA